MQFIFEVKKVQIQMMQDRGYDIEEEEADLLDSSLKEFGEYFASLDKVSRKGMPNRFYLTKTYKKTEGDEGSGTLVYYGPVAGKGSSTGKRKVSHFIETLKSSGDDTKRGIFICDLPLSSAASRTLDYFKHEFDIQVFFYDELSFNLMDHELTPKHILLSEEESREMIKQIGVGMIIKSSDPVIRYYNWPSGRVVRIIRDDSSMGVLSPKSVNYRIIV